GPKELKNWKIAGGSFMGYRGAFDRPPALGAMGLNEFPTEARLADTGLADHGHDLAMARAGLIEDLAELTELGIAADKPAKAPRRDGRKARPHRGRADQLIDFERTFQAFDGARSEDLHHHVPFGPAQHLRRDQDGPRYGHLLKPRRQVRRLADGRVVHPQVAA